jgi:hypothetical protein
VDRLLKIGFSNTEEFRNKLVNSELLNLIRSQDILDIAESGKGLQRGYINYFKRQYKTAKYGRNPGRLPVFIKYNISKHVKDILASMKEIL